MDQINVSDLSEGATATRAAAERVNRLIADGAPTEKVLHDALTFVFQTLSVLEASGRDVSS